MGLEISVFAILALVVAMILAGASYILFTLIWHELDDLSIIVHEMKNGVQEDYEGS